MIWSDAFINLTDTINQTGATVLLGFNEPNNCYDNQACMTPAFAASLWPRLEVQRARGGGVQPSSPFNLPLVGGEGAGWTPRAWRCVAWALGGAKRLVVRC